MFPKKFTNIYKPAALTVKDDEEFPSDSTDAVDEMEPIADRALMIASLPFQFSDSQKGIYLGLWDTWHHVKIAETEIDTEIMNRMAEQDFVCYETDYEIHNLVCNKKFMYELKHAAKYGMYELLAPYL